MERRTTGLRAKSDTTTGRVIFQHCMTRPASPLLGTFCARPCPCARQRPTAASAAVAARLQQQKPSARHGTARRGRAANRRSGSSLAVVSVGSGFCSAADSFFAVDPRHIRVSRGRIADVVYSTPTVNRSSLVVADCPTIFFFTNVRL